jgi:hypothetical protein
MTSDQFKDIKMPNGWKLPLTAEEQDSELRKQRLKERNI